MPALEYLKRQIEIAQALQSVVKTMKAIAAASIRQYERAVESLAEYNHTLEMGLQVVLGNRTDALILPETSKPKNLCAIIFGSDQGMCGQFNEQIATYALSGLQNLSIQSENWQILTVGARVIPPLEAAGKIIEASFTMPSSIAGITPMVQELLLQIELRREQQQIEQILLFYNQPLSNTSHTPHTLQLLPVDPTWLSNLKKQQWNSRTLPTFTMDASQLFASLIRQYFFVSLYRAFAESLASENASRLASMQVAQRNIEERLEALTTQFQQQRQTTITEELLDIVSGFEALNSH
jgi:F-type H+-transporting ATPase subunit gamma